MLDKTTGGSLARQLNEAAQAALPLKTAVASANREMSALMLEKTTGASLARQLNEAAQAALPLKNALAAANREMSLLMLDKTTGGSIARQIQQAQIAGTGFAGMLGRNQFALQQLSFGVQDFAAMVGPMGVAGGLRAASNNLTQFLAIAGSPMAAVFGGIAVGLLIPLAAGLLETSRNSKEAGGSFDRAAKDADRFREALKRLKDEVKSLNEVDIAREATEKQIAVFEDQAKTAAVAKETAKQQMEHPELVISPRLHPRRRGAAIQAARIQAEQEFARQSGLETSASSQAEALRKGLAERTQAKFKAELTGEFKGTTETELAVELEERQEKLSKFVPEGERLPFEQELGKLFGEAQVKQRRTRRRDFMEGAPRAKTDLELQIEAAEEKVSQFESDLFWARKWARGAGTPGGERITRGEERRIKKNEEESLRVQQEMLAELRRLRQAEEKTTLRRSGQR